MPGRTEEKSGLAAWKIKLEIGALAIAGLWALFLFWQTVAPSLARGMIRRSQSLCLKLIGRHPRQDNWQSHSRLQGAYIEGITPTGRATARVLTLNDARRLELRMELMTRGEW